MDHRCSLLATHCLCNSSTRGERGFVSAFETYRGIYNFGGSIFYTNLKWGSKDVPILEEAIAYALKHCDAEKMGKLVLTIIGNKFDEDDKAVNIIEKPVNPPSNYAVPGLYFYDNDVVGIAANLEPSARGEYEITDVNKAYLEAGKLFVSKMDRGMAWLDTGTHHSLMQASQYVQVIEERQGLKIGCIEEIAWRMGYIDDATLEKVARPLQKSGYGDYLLEQLKRGRGSSRK